MNGRRISFSILGLVVVVGGGIGTFLYLHNAAKYVSTDDAMVSGREILISAPTSGKVVDWTGKMDTTYATGSTVGDIQVNQGDSSSLVAIPVPQGSTIVQRSVVNGEYVSIGTPLAYAYNLNKLWVTANVKETELRYVNIGAKVHIYVDAHPNIPLEGTVAEIEPATAATFSLIPTESTNANYTQVTQVVPVKISIDYSPLVSLTPGMSVTVKIDKAES